MITYFPKSTYNMGELCGGLRSAWGQGGPWREVAHYWWLPQVPALASLGRRWTRIPWIVFPVASLLVKPALNLFLLDQSLHSYPLPFAARHVKVFFTTIWNWRSHLRQLSRWHFWQAQTRFLSPSPMNPLIISGTCKSIIHNLELTIKYNIKCPKIDPKMR